MTIGWNTPTLEAALADLRRWENEQRKPKAPEPVPRVHPMKRRRQRFVDRARELAKDGLSYPEVVAYFLDVMSLETARGIAKEAGLQPDRTMTKRARDYLREHPKATSAEVRAAVGCSARLARVVRQKWRRTRRGLR